MLRPPWRWKTTENTTSSRQTPFSRFQFETQALAILLAKFISKKKQIAYNLHKKPHITPEGEKTNHQKKSPTEGKPPLTNLMWKSFSHLLKGPINSAISMVPDLGDRNTNDGWKPTTTREGDMEISTTLKHHSNSYSSYSFLVYSYGIPPVASYKHFRNIYIMKSWK